MSRVNRRDFLRNAILGLGSAPLAGALAADMPSSNPFTLGIASGDVTSNSAVLWTRLAPQPLRADGGMPAVNIPISWELSLDANMSRIVRRGEAQAGPALAHSVHIELEDLTPDRAYWYRFATAKHLSPTGRTKTLPGMDGLPRAARFITASCQNYTHGYFIAYAHILAERPDFIIHLGDYIYDTAYGETFRQHDSEQPPVTLADFRRRHALYKTDPYLKHAHAQLPFFVTIDNHDAVEDNHPDTFKRRTAAYQAWYEHMPVSGYRLAGQHAIDMHRRIQFGELLTISLLDPRQFRDQKNLCPDNPYPEYGFGNYRERCKEVFAEDRTMLGAVQEQWLADNLIHNEAAWNVIASASPVSSFEYHLDGKKLHYTGAWDFYPANRQRIKQALSQARIGHPVILSGDLHSFWAIRDALCMQQDKHLPVTEFVTSSITANWPEPLARPVTDNLPHNPHVAFYAPDKRGYLLHEVNQTTWKTTARAIQDVRDRHSPAFNLASFLVENGKPGFTRIYQDVPGVQGSTDFSNLYA